MLIIIFKLSVYFKAQLHIESHLISEGDCNLFSALSIYEVIVHCTFDTVLLYQHCEVFNLSKAM